MLLRRQVRVEKLTDISLRMCGSSLHDYCLSDPVDTNGWIVSRHKWFMYIMSGTLFPSSQA